MTGESCFKNPGLQTALKSSVLNHVSSCISNTTERFFIRFPNIEKTFGNTKRREVFLTKFKVFRICDETPSRVFDISSLSKVNYGEMEKKS